VSTQAEPNLADLVNATHPGTWAEVLGLKVVHATRDEVIGKTVVGLENHTSFIRAVREGVLRGTARPLTRGRRTQVWEVSIADAKGALVATGRVRLLVIEPDASVAGAALGSMPA